MEEQTGQNALKVDVSTRLAFERTRVAYEWTMMAWIRTATSLILSDRSAAPWTTESPNRATRLRLNPGEHRTLFADPGDPRTPTKYQDAWSAIRRPAALAGCAGRGIDFDPRVTCSSRNNLSSIAQSPKTA